MYRHEWYQKIYERIPAIVEEARQFGEKLSLGNVGGQFGLYSGGPESAPPREAVIRNEFAVFRVLAKSSCCRPAASRPLKTRMPTSGDEKSATRWQAGDYA